LTDFSFDPVDANGPVANRVQAGKRPRSSMAPTLVFEKGTRKLVLSTGSPGGSAIINYVGKVLVGTLDWGLNVQQAISLPNFGSRNGPTEIEQDRVPEPVIEQLKERGHNVNSPVCPALFLNFPRRRVPRQSSFRLLISLYEIQTENGARTHWRRRTSGISGGRTERRFRDSAGSRLAAAA
jgi:hypothetical protein